jgi:hypothetical protein
MWPVIVLTIIILIAACAQSRPPSFLTRVREDCTNGDQWTCDLLTSLSNATGRGSEPSRIGFCRPDSGHVKRRASSQQT